MKGEAYCDYFLIVLQQRKPANCYFVITRTSLSNSSVKEASGEAEWELCSHQ